MDLCREKKLDTVDCTFSMAILQPLVSGPSGVSEGASVSSLSETVDKMHLR